MDERTLEEKLLEGIKLYLDEDIDNEEDGKLKLIIERAVYMFRGKMSYPKRWSEVDIAKHMNQFYYCVFDLCIYYYSKQGGEFQTNHSENGVGRTWSSEDQIYINHGAHPFVGSVL